MDEGVIWREKNADGFNFPEYHLSAQFWVSEAVNDGLHLTI